MTEDKPIIYGENLPIITLTRRQIEEDWYNLHSQLTRITQECEKLKEENFTFEQLIKEYEKYGAIEEIIQQNNQLKVENKELKSNVLTRCPECSSEYLSPTGAELYDELKQLKAENDKLKYQVEVFTRQLENANKEVINEKQKGTTERQKNEQAEQKLERIRELAMAIMDNDVEENFCYLYARQILQIIDEVNNEE